MQRACGMVIDRPLDQSATGLSPRRFASAPKATQCHLWTYWPGARIRRKNLQMTCNLHLTRRQREVSRLWPPSLMIGKLQLVALAGLRIKLGFSAGWRKAAAVYQYELRARRRTIA